ncbi:MAG TPA: polyprenyl synthetase family protein, partial [Bacillota bacterium]|nr:polyprenyl synthetase family protein [Bacillota bacterium]
MKVDKEELISELKNREPLILNIFNQERYRRCFKPEPLRQATYTYLNRPAKRFRPGILLFCCGAVGGWEKKALLAAAAVEVYHTWTLVHDDIIDNDPKRRGFPTVHEEIRLEAIKWDYSEKEAAEMGRNIAILAGDLQHAWSMRLLLDLAETGVSLPVIYDLVRRLEFDVTSRLLEGEAQDVLFARRRIEELSEDEVLSMLEQKTGILYQYAALAGAAIGLDQTPSENKLIEVLGNFARQCGIAFQLQDDILGITGDEKLLGKAVGSDIREGKRTTILLHAFAEAEEPERQFLIRWLGNPEASEREIEKIQQILIEYDGIEYTRKLAEAIVTDALNELVILPDSKYKEL